MTIGVLVHGALGKMGSLACDTVKAADGMHLVAGTDRGDDLAQNIQTHRPDVVVDFTLPDCVFDNATTIIAEGARPVIGTSGLSEEQIKALTAQCDEHKRGGIVVPNFSIAAVLMMKASAMAAKHLPECEIIEMHHTQKVDSPSGTAQKTAELIAEHRDHAPDCLDKTRGKRVGDVPIHSVRLPGYFASQEVIFGQLGETLSITHRAHDREAMMPGVLFAIRQCMTLNTLIYGLEHLIQ